MGRNKLYHTEEERKIANAVKSRRYYRKKHPVILRITTPRRVFKNKVDLFSHTMTNDNQNETINSEVQK